MKVRNLRFRKLVLVVCILGISALLYSSSQRWELLDDSAALPTLQKYRDMYSQHTSMEPGDPNRPETFTEWWQGASMIDWYITSPIRYECRKRKYAGNWRVCQDLFYRVEPPCLVYSFGVFWDYSFDDAMESLGCEVHAFDPSMGEKDHHHSQHVTFHNMGIGHVDNDMYKARHDRYVKEDQFWKLRTLKTAMKELGHEGRVLDILKLDIEGNEWAVLQNLFETDMMKYVRQFELEYHLFPKWPAKDLYVGLYQLVKKLREMGFKEYWTEPKRKYLNLPEFNLQGDFAYVNTRFSPPTS